MKGIIFKLFFILGLFVFLIATPEILRGQSKTKPGREKLISKFETVLNQAIEKRNSLHKQYQQSNDSIEKQIAEKQLIKLDMDIADIENRIADIASGKPIDWLGQSEPASIGDDEYEDNDTMNQAAQVTPGKYDNLKLYDDDWFKVYVQAGKDLKVSIQGTFGGAELGDIDVEIYNSSGTFIVSGISGRDDETVYASDLSAGWYYLRLQYFFDGPLQNIYSLQIETGTGFGEGKMTGTVTDSTGNPMANLIIQIFKLYVDPGPSNYMSGHEYRVQTDANGNYKIDVPPRGYKVLFFPRATGLNYVNQYYNQKSTYDEADEVSVTAGHTTSGIDGQLYQGGEISGRVTDSGGNALGGVNAIPYDQYGNRVGSSGRTNNNGDYTAFSPAGNVKLQFLLGTYRYEWYNDKTFFSSADNVVVQKGKKTSNINAQLSTDLGSITGKVTNSSGEGIQYVQVSAYEPSEIPVITRSTNENGDYYIGTLPTGNFKLYFYAESMGYAPEWYNNKTTFAAANTVAVTLNHQTPNINAQLAVGTTNNPPTVNIVTPSTGAAVSGYIEIQTDYSDDCYGLNQFELYLDSQLLTRLNAPNISPGSHSAILDTSAYSNGAHTIKAKVTDSASQTAQHSITVTVNNPADLPPTVSITNPPGGSTASGTVTITVNAADDKGINKVEFYVDNTKIGEDTTNSYTYDWNTTTQTNGSHTVKAIAYDTLNQTSQQEVTVTVTNTAGDTPPAVTIINPADGAAVTGMVSVEASASDDFGISFVKFYVDGTLIGTDNNSPYQTDWNSAGFYNGSHTMQAVASDTAGQTGQHRITVNINNDVDEPPVIYINEMYRYCVVSGAIDIHTYASDDHGIKKIVFYLDDVKMEEKTGGDCVFTWDTTAYSNEVHEVKMIAYDTSNYKAIKRWPVTVHNISGDAVPQIDDTSVTSADGNGQKVSAGSVSGTVTITLTLSDDNGIAKVEFYVDGQKKYQCTASPYRFAWNTTQYANGEHTLSAIVTDSAGQTTTGGGTLNVDNGGDTNPTISILSPENNETISGAVAIAANAKDDKGVTKVEFYLDNSLKLTDSSSPYQFIVDTAKLSDGVHFIKAKVYDTTGHTAEQQINVTVDNTPAEALSVSITSPYDTANVAGPVVVKASASPASEVTKMEFYIDGSKVGTVSAAPYQYNWASSSYAMGNHTIQAVACGSGNKTAQDSITLNVVAYTPPVIVPVHTKLNFVYVINGSAPPSQSVLISNSGTAALNWTAASGETWISLAPTSGTGIAFLTVSVNPSGLAAGTYSGSIGITDPGATNSPQSIAVSLKIYEANTTTAPFGEFATPADGATVSSSIPVTGWALDDTGVASVKIYRQDGTTLVYIGDALLVEGARSDVEQAYPDYPMNYKAGWGYMLLTNFLPGGGNGTFTLYAVATDTEGKQVTLGTKTITCDNAHAVKPFGAIDTPNQGGAASGSKYRNQGWVLTPMPNNIPTNGNTVNVYIDGVYKGHPVYNIYRPDVAALFPGYANSNGSLGYFDFDATAYADGVHTIFWTAQDSGGNADGIGSRYFSILNSAGDSKQEAMRAEGPKLLSEIPVNYTKPISLISGYETDVIPQEMVPDDKGNINIRVKELGRLEIHLGDYQAQVEHDSSFYSGYLVVGDQLRTLPIGSFLDRKRGIFYWHPGPGFLGEYRFVFIEKAANSIIGCTDLTINIAPAN